MKKINDIIRNSFGKSLIFILIFGGILNAITRKTDSITNILSIIIVYMIIVKLADKLIGKSKKVNPLDQLKEDYKAMDVIEAQNFFVLLVDYGLILVNRSFNGKVKQPEATIKEINEAVMYEDGAEKSLGNAIAGGVLFGAVGAIAGSNVKNKVVTNMGLKLYTDSGFYDVNFIENKIEKDHRSYKKAYTGVNNLYNHILKLQKKSDGESAL